jgi:peroxiredoxin
MTTIRIALTLVCTLVALAGPAVAAPAVGEQAPALIATEIDNTHFDLAAFRGKVVIVNFWATWCPPCRQEMPAIDAFYAQFHARGVEVVGISVDRSRDRDDVIKVAQTVHYPVAIMADAQTNDFGKPAVLPVTYIVDPAGNVRAILTPDKVPVTEDSLQGAVTRLLPGNHPGT